VKSLDLNKLRTKKSTIISSEEALKDVIPLDDALTQSIKEMISMRQGKMKKRTWDDLKKELNKDE
jgi:hypothetical protein